MTAPRFDRLLNWTRANLAGGDLETHLPAWLWGKNKDGEWKTIDPNSAADADVWMAYTLVEAGRLWKSPYYSHLGRKMMAQIAKRRSGRSARLWPHAFAGVRRLPA